MDWDFTASGAIQARSPVVIFTIETLPPVSTCELRFRRLMRAPHSRVAKERSHLRPHLADTPIRRLIGVPMRLSTAYPAMHGAPLFMLAVLGSVWFAACRPNRPPTPAETSQPSVHAPKWRLLVNDLPDLDTSRVVALPGDSFRVFRTDISLTFKPNVSDSAKALFIDRHSMHVIGVTNVGRFFVRIPDPGPTYEGLNRVIEALRHEPEIERAGWIPRDPLH